jgi:hypothetical protein
MIGAPIAGPLKTRAKKPDPAPNPARGEASINIGDTTVRLRPSFAALVAAEAEVGPLFCMVERAADGQLSLGDMAALFWHCADPKPATLSREAMGEAILAGGLAQATPALRQLLTQILQGQ